MNEKQLLKKINSIENKDGNFTLVYVFEMMEQRKNTLNLVQKLYRRIKKEKTLQDIISDNLELILSKTSYKCIDAFIKKMLKSKELNDVIQKNFELFLKKFGSSKEANSRLKDFISLYASSSTQNKNFLSQNVSLILKYSHDCELFSIIQELKKTSPNNLELLNDKLEKKKLAIIGKIINEAICSRTLFDSYKEEAKEYSETLLIMFEELLKSENKRWIDVEKVGKGFYSDVYSIGDKIIKIGIPRGTHKMPNHRRILQPLIRTNLLNKENKEIGCIEVTERTIIKQCNQNELYEIYKELREDGIIWTDVKSENVGQLVRPNRVYLNGKTISINTNSTGLDGNNYHKPLQAGELVIIDSDYIYSDKDSGITWIDNGSFEKRYQREVAKKTAEKCLTESKNVVQLTQER